MIEVPDQLRDAFLAAEVITDMIDTRMFRVVAPEYKAPVRYVVYTLLNPGIDVIASGPSSRQTDTINYLFVGPTFESTKELFNAFLTVIPREGWQGTINDTLCVSKAVWLTANYEEGYDSEANRFYISINLSITYGV